MGVGGRLADELSINDGQEKCFSGKKRTSELLLLEDLALEGALAFPAA